MTERDIVARLAALGLVATASGFDDLVAMATKKRWSPVQIFEHVLSIEEQERSRRGLQRRLKRSRLERFKPMVDFDWNWPSKIDRPLVESALRLDFIEDARNIVLVAPQGLGKSMIAQNIVHQAVIQGHGALFISAAQLLLDLAAQESARALERRFKHYARVGLLVIDEIGFLAFDARNADLLFQVITRRYEKKSVVLTTNLAFRDWSTIFPNATCATALIDRVVHHADVIAIEGESYRAREADAQAKARRARKKPAPDSEPIEPAPPT